jgi:hypothetical protein
MLHGLSSCQTQPGKSVSFEHRSQHAEQQEENQMESSMSRITTMTIFVLELNVNKIWPQKLKDIKGHPSLSAPLDHLAHGSLARCLS